MQKLLRSSKLSCSKPLITLLKQQISNCCTVKKSHGQCALLSDCYPHKSSVVVCTLCISNAYARWDFFTVQQFDICCFRSVMKGLLQLSFELRRSFCINICCFIIRINDSRVIILQNHIRQIRHIFVLHLDLVSRKQVTWPPEIIGHVTIRSATPDLLLVAFGIFPISLSATEICHILVLHLDLVSRKQVTWPSKIIGHVTIWSATPDFLWVGFGISQISLSVTKLLLQNWSCAYFAWEFPQKREMWLYGIP